MLKTVVLLNIFVDASYFFPEFLNESTIQKNSNYLKSVIIILIDKYYL